jgi:hypothetical protein
VAYRDSYRASLSYATDALVKSKSVFAPGLLGSLVFLVVAV